MNESIPDPKRDTTMTIPPPLNGTKTHPLKPAAYEMLERLARGPVVGPEINPGLRNRFEREGLAEWVDLPSPYKTKPGMYPHMRITEAGRRALASRHLCGLKGRFFEVKP